jgi:ATP-binding cassette subfamily C protein
LLRYLYKDKSRFTILIAINTIRTLFVTGLALVYGNLVNSVADGIETKKLIVNFALALIYTIATGAMQWVKHYYSGICMARVLREMQNDMFSTLINSKYNYIAKEDSSKYYDNMTNDLKQVRDSMWSFIHIIDRIVAVVSSFVAAVVLNYQLALLMLGMTVLMGILPFFVKKKLDIASLNHSDATKLWARSVKENLQGISIIKSFAAEKKSFNEIVSTNEIVFKAGKKRTLVEAVIDGITTIIQNVAMLSLVGLTCYFVILKIVGIGAVLSIVQIGMSFYGAINGVAGAVTYYLGSKRMRDRVSSIIFKRNNSTSTTSTTFCETLEFKNVSFSYGTSERKILENVSVVFKKGKKYLILGKSGSGKSTLLKLIAKFYDSTEGTITLDGRDYLDITESEVTSVVAIAQQNCYLFHRSLRDNIDYLQNNDDKRLVDVIEFTHLKDFISQLPAGIDTIVDEEVHQVSGGEKLRINLARALYRGGDILLLDEVTSSLDKTTASIVEHNLLTLTDVTLVNVCHKFNDSTLQQYDEIIIIENGLIVEKGNYFDIEKSEKLATYRSQLSDEQFM